MKTKKQNKTEQIRFHLTPEDKAAFTSYFCPLTSSVIRRQSLNLCRKIAGNKGVLLLAGGGCFIPLDKTWTLFWSPKNSPEALCRNPGQKYPEKARSLSGFCFQDETGKVIQVFQGLPLDGVLVFPQVLLFQGDFLGVYNGNRLLRLQS